MQIYVHIPFCKQKCRYCDFTSFVGQETQAEKYTQLLLKEAEARAETLSRDPITTLYIGGGTPSLLPPFLLTELCLGLKKIFHLSSAAEFTIEANPGTVTELWLEAAVRAGMNRLSIGMQAGQPEMLETLGRIHNYRNVLQTVGLARAFGVSNLNMDLMFGIPGQTMNQWLETLDMALDSHPEHISAYGLIPEEGTPLYTDLKHGRLSLPDPDLERNMYDAAISVLKDNGFDQYEISNFAASGFECRHNIGYWTQVPYLGLGVSAASMQIVQAGNAGMVCRRRTNPYHLEAYEKMLADPEKRADPGETVLPAEARFETLMLGLRMNRGVSADQFEKLHGITLERAFGEKIRLLQAQGLLTFREKRLRMTRRGFDIQNSVLVELMEE